MFKLYYSGANSYLGIQKRPENSLGGYVSQNIVPNGQLGNLFSMISEYTIDNEKISIIGLFIKNEGLVTENDVTLYFNYPENCNVKLEVAAVIPAQDTNGGYYIESIVNGESLPYDGVFYEADGQENAVNLGNIEAGKYLGIWLKRSILSTVKLTDQQLYDNFKEGTVLSKKEEISMIIEDESDHDSSS